MSEVKPRIGIVIDKDLLDWIDEEVDKKRFASRSHAIQVCVLASMKKDGEKPERFRCETL